MLIGLADMTILSGWGAIGILCDSPESEPAPQAENVKSHFV